MLINLKENDLLKFTGNVYETQQRYIVRRNKEENFDNLTRRGN